MSPVFSATANLVAHLVTDALWKSGETLPELGEVSRINIELLCG